MGAKPLNLGKVHRGEGLKCLQGSHETFHPTVLTFGDDSLQTDDVGVIELAHDAGLTQEIAPLLLRVSGFQGLDGHADLPLPGRLQAPATHLAELTCEQTPHAALGYITPPQCVAFPKAALCLEDALFSPR